MLMTSKNLWLGLRRGMSDLFSLCVPTWCVLCSEADFPVCEACQILLRPDPLVRMLPIDHNRQLTVVAAAAYEAELREVILAYKERGRADTVAALAPLLATSLHEVLVRVQSQVAGQLVVCVPMPSTRRGERERGYRHVDVLLSRALRVLARSRVAQGARLPQLQRWLRTRQTSPRADQVGLGRNERHRNLSHTMRASRSAFGRHVVLVDDVVTSGATLREAHRALELQGARVIAAVALANTAKHHRS